MKNQILLIDDAKAIHSLVSAMLADEPVDIHSAFDATYGLTLTKSLKPDLILLDVEMPGINGYEVCQKLKADPELFNIPVIFLTALSRPEEKVDGLELGAIDYVTKPFNPAELLARVRASLRTHHVIQMLEQKALIDFLTGLGNRNMFKQRLTSEVSLRVRTGKSLACIVVDVDDFQAINDTQGHPFADRVLQAIAKIIQSVCRVEDVPCRLAGDAFVILTPNTEPPEASALASRIELALTKLQLNCRGLPVKVNCSVAVAPSIDIYDHLMLERANHAIELARKKASLNVSMADPDSQTSAVAAA